MDTSDIFNPANKAVANGQADWFSYPLNFTNLLSAASGGVPQVAQIQIDAASQFFWTALTYQAILTPGTSTYTQDTNPVPLVTILIVDGGSNRQLMNQPVFLGQIAGVGTLPGRRMHPRLFDRSSVISVTVQGFDAATWGLLQINFEGFKIYG